MIKPSTILVLEPSSSKSGSIGDRMEDRVPTPRITIRIKIHFLPSASISLAFPFHSLTCLLIVDPWILIIRFFLNLSFHNIIIKVQHSPILSNSARISNCSFPCSLLFLYLITRKSCNSVISMIHFICITFPNSKQTDIRNLWKTICKFNFANISFTLFPPLSLSQAKARWSYLRTRQTLCPTILQWNA